MLTLNEVATVIRRAVRTGTNVSLVGEPGIGKTSVIEQTVAAMREEDPTFGYWNLYTPALSPIDFSVPMPEQSSGTLRMYNNEQLPNALLSPNARGILFLGERDNADPATNKALQKYINNELMGTLIKPKGVVVVSDSNDISHRSGAVQQSLALLSRSRIVHVRVDADCTLDYFAKIGLNPYVQAYLSLRKEHVSTFETVLKNRSYEVWANPRAWERLGVALEDAEAHGEKFSEDEIIGDIGEAVGREFVAFLHAAKELVSYEEIVTNPLKATRPDKLSDTYAIIAMLAVSGSAADFPSIKAYVERWGLEVQVLFLRLLMNNKGANRAACCATKAYRDWFSNKALQAACGVVG